MTWQDYSIFKLIEHYNLLIWDEYLNDNISWEECDKRQDKELDRLESLTDDELKQEYYDVMGEDICERYY